MNKPVWVVIVLIALFGGFYAGGKYGINVGIEAYHQACFKHGGIVINEAGEAVACQGLVVIPPEEQKKLQEPVDKGVNI